MIDLTEEENCEFDVVGAILSKLPSDTDFIICQIEKYKTDKTSFEYLYFDVDDLNYHIQDTIDRNDFKNGCRYDEDKNEFLVIGSLAHFPDIHNTEYVTQDQVTMRFKKSCVVFTEDLEEIWNKS